MKFLSFENEIYLDFSFFSAIFLNIHQSIILLFIFGEKI